MRSPAVVPQAGVDQHPIKARQGHAIPDGKPGNLISLSRTPVIAARLHGEGQLEIVLAEHILQILIKGV